MQLPLSSTAAILAFVPAAFGAALESSTPASTTCTTTSTVPTLCISTTIVTTTCKTTPSGTVGYTTTTSTSWNLNESTSACPVATNLPFCAMACIHAAAIDIGCVEEPDMHHCQCEHFSDLSSVAGPCILGACGQDLALQASSVGRAICTMCEGICN